MIYNEKEAMAIAGVLGGRNSGVSDQTKNIFIESANFDSVSIRKTAKRHGLNTQASFRFERGVDPTITHFALKRAALLIRALAGGEISSEISDYYPHPVSPHRIDFRISYHNKIIGKAIPKKEILAILEGLDIKVTDDQGDVLKLEVPNYRVDVLREIDVIEEVLRIYGYNNIETPERYSATIIPNDEPDNEVLLNKVSDHLTSQGFMEAKSNSLTSSIYYRDIKTWPLDRAICIKNPLSSDLDVLRQTMLFDSLSAVRHNQNRQTSNLKLYEFGQVYHLEGQQRVRVEEAYVSMTLVGRRYAENWNAPADLVDLFDLKGHVESLFEVLNVNAKTYTLSDSVAEEFHYGMAFTVGDRLLAQGGRVAASITDIFGIKNEVFFLELNWDLLKEISVKQKITYVPVPKYPQVRRDLSLLMNQNISFAEIEQVVQKVDRKLLQSVGLFDVYQGHNLPPGKKSYAIRFIFQDRTKTLTDKQIDKVMQKLILALKDQLSVELR